jgi:hypothetical protein
MFKAMIGDAGFSFTSSRAKNPFYRLEIEREHLLEQTLERLKEADPKELRKHLQVVFKGEEGIDAGGVTKEVRCGAFLWSSRD